MNKRLVYFPFNLFPPTKLVHYDLIVRSKASPLGQEVYLIQVFESLALLKQMCQAVRDNVNRKSES